ncbi:MAG TPA: hypothetical protein GX507_02475, partial [Clostridia bacterium]|nr:hypothetical protein [Clostridia bacterium]
MSNRNGTKHPNEIEIKLFRRRVLALAVTLSLLLYVLLSRDYEIQVISGDELARLAEAQQCEKVVIAEPRGRILDRNGKSLVREGWGYGAAVFPSSVVDAMEVARFLRAQSPPGQKVIVEKIRAGKPFLVSVDLADVEEFTADALGKGGRSTACFPSTVTGNGGSWRDHIADEVAVFATPVPGVVLVRIPDRIGIGSLTSDLIGFYDPVSRKGLTGIERAMDSWLRGVGYRAVYRFTDGGGKPLQGLGYVVREESTFRGHDIILTVDYRIQKIVEDALKRWVRRGAAMVMDAETGEVLAAAGVPSKRTAKTMWTRGYDAGFLVDALRRWVRWVDTAADEGDALKVLIASGLCKPTRGYHGEENIEALIYDGEQAMYGGEQAIYQGEQAICPSAAEWRAAFAGKCTVTLSPLQMAQIFAVIGNRGKTVKPWYIKAIRDENGAFVLDREETNMKAPDIVDKSAVEALLKAVEETANGRYPEGSLGFTNDRASWCVGWLGCREDSVPFR